MLIAVGRPDGEHQPTMRMKILALHDLPFTVDYLLSALALTASRISQTVNPCAPDSKDQTCCQEIGRISSTLDSSNSIPKPGRSGNSSMPFTGLGECFSKS